mmetsp:Transcript_507/g.1768  ORF Transcript_507/g.1768 Transcript_507/m.1768 type:complete len:238 (+) Transcript_507:2443-3156(+)
MLLLKLLLAHLLEERYDRQEDVAVAEEGSHLRSGRALSSELARDFRSERTHLHEKGGGSLHLVVARRCAAALRVPVDGHRHSVAGRNLLEEPGEVQRDRIENVHLWPRCVVDQSLLLHMSRPAPQDGRRCLGVGEGACNNGELAGEVDVPEILCDLGHALAGDPRGDGAKECGDMLVAHLIAHNLLVEGALLLTLQLERYSTLIRPFLRLCKLLGAEAHCFEAGEHSREGSGYYTLR